MTVMLLYPLLLYGKLFFFLFSGNSDFSQQESMRLLSVITKTWEECTGRMPPLTGSCMKEAR